MAEGLRGFFCFPQYFHLFIVRFWLATQAREADVPQGVRRGGRVAGRRRTQGIREWGAELFPRGARVGLTGSGSKAKDPVYEKEHKMMIFAQINNSKNSTPP